MINYKFDKYLNSDLRLMQEIPSGISQLLAGDYDMSKSARWNRRLLKRKLLNDNEGISRREAKNIATLYVGNYINTLGDNASAKDLAWLADRTSLYHLDENGLLLRNKSNFWKGFAVAGSALIGTPIAGEAVYDNINWNKYLKWQPSTTGFNGKELPKALAKRMRKLNTPPDSNNIGTLTLDQETLPVPVNTQITTNLPESKSFKDIVSNGTYNWADIINASDYGNVKNMLQSLYAGKIGEEGFTDKMAEETYNHFISNENGFRDMRGRTRGFGVDKYGNYTYDGAEGLFIYTPGENNSVGTWKNTNNNNLSLRRGSGNDSNYYVRGWNFFQQGGQMYAQDLQEQLAEMICRAAFVKIAEAAANQLLIAPKLAVEAVLKEAKSNPQKLQETLSSKDVLQQAELFIALNAPLMIEVVKEKGWKGLYLAIMTLKAKQGTKLSYINSLKGICPEGYEMSYMKAGGKMCPVCKKKVKNNKDCGGVKMKMHATGGISEMMNQIKTDLLACGGKMKKVKKDLDGGKAFSDKEMSDYGKQYYMAERKTNYPNASQALLEGKEPITVWRKDKNGKKFKFTGIFKNNSSNPFDLHPYTK